MSEGNQGKKGPAMISDRDIYRSAAVMIRRYGDDAALEAGRRGDSLLDTGDIEGYGTWLQIVRAIGQLQKTSPTDGDMVH